MRSGNPSCGAPTLVGIGVVQAIHLGEEDEHSDGGGHEEDDHGADEVERVRVVVDDDQDGNGEDEDLEDREDGRRDPKGMVGG